jgi:3-hydroxybutyryl-CoA dehydratase
MSQPRPHGRYFEEFAVGDKIITTARTVTEADIVNFAGLSGDYNQIHTDAHFAAESPFQARVAHGLLVLSIASGLAVQTRFMEQTVQAFREISDWKFSGAVYIGDTIHVEMEVLETKAFPRLGNGLLVIGFAVKNQKGETVQKGKWTVLIQAKPKE